MGQLFQQGGMTNPGSALLNANGSAAMVGDPSKMRDIDLKTHSQLRPYVPGTPDPNQPLPSVGTPTFQQAASAGATPGGANAMSPGLNKAGKLVTLLTSGLQGAMAGRAASEQTVAATGGRRSGGAGTGFEAGYTLPWQRQAQQQAVQRGGLENQLLENQVKYAPQLNFLKILGEQAGIGKTQAETGAIPTKQALEQAQAEAANYKEDLNLGLIDLRTRQPVNAAGLAPLTAEEAQVLGKQPGERVPLKLKNTASEIAVRGLATVNTEEGVFERNRNTGSMTRLGSNPRMMFAPGEQFVPVAADPNDPGKVTLMKKGKAAAQGVSLPQGAATTAAKAEARSEVPTKIGDQKVAFNTMIAHADLLRKAVQALGNGDVQALAGLKNEFKNAFGYSGPITAQAIADAYGGEVTNVIAKGHITDKEMGKTSKTINPMKQNYATMDSVLSAYQALAQSKMNMLVQQANAARGGRQQGMPSGATHIVPGPDGKKHYTNAQGTVDLGVAP